MSDDHPIPLLEELGQSVPDRRPAASRIIELGRLARARRRRRLVAAGAMGLACCVALSLVVRDIRDRDLVATPGTPGNPVITMPEGGNDHPAAEVEGRLSLVQGCLLVGDELAFWPHGTTWDPAPDEVVFDDSWEASPVRVGDLFSGGGGSYSVAAAVLVLDGPAGAALKACADRTGVIGVVYAVP